MPSSEYMREWRQTDSGQAALRRQKQRDKARRRAMTTLMLRHQGEFDMLLTMHLVAIQREDQNEVDRPS